MASFDREVDHYEVIVRNEKGILYAEKEFFSEEEAVDYARKAFQCGWDVRVVEVDNLASWWN